MNKIFIYLGAIIVLASTSCATVVRGPEEQITISTEPSGASVEIFDSFNQRVAKVTTPSGVRLKKSRSPFSGEYYKVKIAKEGYKDSEFTLGSRTNVGAFVIGNFFLWLAPGMIVDGLSGAMFNIIPANPNGIAMTVSADDSAIKVDLAKE